jgi:hypothetical protein
MNTSRLLVLALVATIAGCSPTPTANSTTSAGPGAGPTLDETRALVKEAYIYGYPLVDNYRFLHGRAVNTQSPMYKVPINQLGHEDGAMKAGQAAVQTVNADTPYSRGVLDLRAEPMVLSMPRIEKHRYYSAQLIDLYTHNFAYLGTRTTGNDGGHFLIAGPSWTGGTPAGITKVVPSETELVTVILRTQLFDDADLDAVSAIQSRYTVQPLSAFLRQAAPPAAPAIAFIEPLPDDAAMKSSLDFFAQLNFVLQFSPTHPSERDLMARFATIGIGAGKPFDASALTAEQRAAFAGGIADAWKELGALIKRADAGEVTSGEAFGTREHLKNNYLYRMAGDVIGIYGNSEEEAIYPMLSVDSEGAPLDGSRHRYTVRFAPGAMPPVNAFWSLTMYDLPARLLVANPLDRYLINSPMLPRLVKDADGGITLHIQHESPGKAREANWLPAPNGPFFMALRLYLPGTDALDGKWRAPQVQRVAK